MKDFSALNVVHFVTTGTKWYCTKTGRWKKAVSEVFIFDLLNRAFCGLGPMILTLFMNITVSFKNLGAPISHISSSIIINLMKFSSASPCCRRSGQIFGQFEFRSTVRHGLNIEGTRGVRRFSARLVERLCVLRLSSYCDVSIPTHQVIELSVRRGQSAGQMVYFEDFGPLIKTFLPLRRCWSA